MQDLIRSRPGVLFTRVGYTGGDTPNTTYRSHGSHAVAIEVTYDPSATTYRELLEFFFQIHDPSTPNRQGNDVGTSYRSAIFYLDEEQRRVAEDTIADVDTCGLWPARSSPRSRQLGRSGRLSPNTRTTCCAAPTATPATSLGRPGCSRGVVTSRRGRRPS